MVRALNRLKAHARSHPAKIAFAWMMGGLATIAAVVIGSLLAVVFAATMAVVLVLGTALAAMAAMAWRLNRLQPRPQPVRVIDARKVGHSWVAYGWDERR